VSGGDYERGLRASGLGAEEDNSPLTDREREMVKRLFSDPFSIPLEFKAWLISFLESNPPLFTTASIFGFRSELASQIAASSQGFAVGTLVQYAGAVDPPDAPKWIIADGRLLNRTTYALLFTAIGTAYGVGDGSTTFGIPDTRGRVLVGLGTHADVNALGDNEGAAVADRAPSHHHLVTARQDSSPNASTNAAGNFINQNTFKTTGNPNLQDKPAFVTVNHLIYTG
jgi:microcystin-dependent protein